MTTWRPCLRLHLFPFLQRGILTALPERPCARTFDLHDLASLFIDAKLQTRAPVTVAATVRVHPLPWFESWPIAFGLVSALRADYPFAVTIVEPGIRRRWIGEPPATSFKAG